MFLLNLRGLMLLMVAAGLGLVPTSAKAQQFVVKDPEKRVVFQADALKIAPEDDELKKLLILRFNEALAETTVLYEEVFWGKTPLLVNHSAGYRLLKASVEVFDTPQKRVTFLKQLRDFAAHVEEMETVKKNAGQGRPGAKELAVQFRLEIDIHLLKEKKRAEKAK